MLFAEQFNKHRVKLNRNLNKSMYFYVCKKVVASNISDFQNIEKYQKIYFTLI